MAEKAEFEVELEYTSVGSAKTVAELDRLIDKIDRLARENELTSKAQDQLSGAVIRTQKTVLSAGKDIEKIGRTSLPTLRYALYDVSTTLAVAGAAMTGFSFLAFKAAIDYERAFANVIRTNDDLMSSTVAAERAFEGFVQLASEIPMSFQNLSQIGTLAGQLGVATGRLEDFTRTTAQFSTVTGESIDTTATALGRLDALLPDVQGNYDALGSSILNVGINSVATEGQVISIATQLAGIGSQAGLTADELIGLSGALASVGIQPELARGTITRLFGQISRAVSVGGESLEGFARISGSSADEFSSKWSSNAMGAVLDIFRGIQSRGSEAEAALRSVGITSVRDVPAILRLAQTVDSVLVPALENAKTGFEDGTQLADNYGVISETTAARLQILANNFQSLLAELGESAIVFKGFIDVANGFLEWLREIQKNPITAFLSQLTVGVTAIGGVLILLLAGLVRVRAGMLAFQTAMASAGVQSTGLRGQLAALTGAFVGVNTQTAIGASGMSRLSGSMKGLGLASVALIAIPVAQWITDWMAKLQNASVDSTTLTNALFKIDANASETVKADIQNVIDQAIQSLGSSTTSTTLIENLFTGFGAGIGNAIGKSFYDNAEVQFDAGLQRLGQKTSEWWQSNPWDNGNPTMWAGLFDSSYEELDKLEEAFVSAWEAASSETQKQAILDSYKDLSDQVVELGGSTTDMAYNFTDFWDVVGSGVDQTALLTEQNQALEASYESLQNEMLEIVNDVYSTVNAHYDLFNALSDVGDAFVNEGAAVAFTGSTMQNAIKGIIEQSGGAGSAAANLQVLFDYLVQGGFASAAQLTQLQSVIAGLINTAGGKISAPTMSASDFSGFTAGVNNARASMDRASGSAAKLKIEIRTLLDYASDLAKVWNRAFDIRFSGQETLDTITSQFIKIREENDRAAEAIRNLRNDIRGLNSDISIQEYYLSIAIEYGDTLRAEAIEAELEKTRAALADKTAALQIEQDKANKSLVGNTAASIENRDTITGLISAYQKHIEALAASGASQDVLLAETARLKAEFIAQAAQLGYNQAELALYASAFDDVTTAINLVPRNITVAANTNPAVVAFNEMQKAINDANNAASGLRSALGSPMYVPPIDTGNIVRAGLHAEAAALRREFMAYAFGGVGATGVLGAFSAYKQSRLNQLASQGFANGGYTGAGGKYEPAGVVHRGEYVIPKRDVNQNTGLPYADALGRHTNGVRGYATGGYVRPSSSSSQLGAVALTAGTIQALAQAVQQYIVVDGRVLGETTSNAYAQSTAVGAN